MAYLKLRSSASTFRGRVGFSAFLRQLSGSAVEELDNGEAPVPSWAYWKLRSALSDAKAREADANTRAVDAEARYALAVNRADADAREYLASIAQARLEILEFRYRLKARGIPELLIKSVTSDASLYCKRKSKDASLSEDEQKSLKDLATAWFPQARKEIWQVIFELPRMKVFLQDMQILLSSKDMHLLVEKALAFHKEFHHSHHCGVRQRDCLIFVREHMRSNIRDVTVDHMHLEGFLKAMAKAINVNVSFVDESDIIGDTDD